MENPMIAEQEREDARIDSMSRCYNCDCAVADPDICDLCGEALMCSQCSYDIPNVGKVCQFCSSGLEVNSNINHGKENDNS